MELKMVSSLPLLSCESPVSVKKTLIEKKVATRGTTSSRTEFKDILIRNISQMIKKTVPICTRTVISGKVNGNCINNMIRIS